MGNPSKYKSMKYITYKNSKFDNTLTVNNVWDVNCENLEEQYIEFMQKKAKELNVVIHPHWLNILNHTNHNNHLSIVEYSNKEKQWYKIKRQWNIDKFISEILQGYKENYRSIFHF